MNSTSRINLVATRLSFLLCVTVISTQAKAETKNDAPRNARMCVPGKLVFSDDFEPATVSDRWSFKAEFALRDGALLRTTVNPTATRRVFLKDASFHNAIIQFDFRLSGQTTELRLVTGSGGHYNSVTQIHHDHFQVTTPTDRSAGIVPSQVGECIHRAPRDQWSTMTIEYWGDEILAHLSGEEFFVLGRHLIIDRTRKYFAFQFDLPGASIDNVRIWSAAGQREQWSETRKKLAASQEQRAPVRRDPAQRYKIELMNLQSRLTLEDQSYRDLVARHRKLEAALHADYPEAFVTHKQLGKRFSNKRKKLKAASADYKQMEVAVHRASRAEDDYVLSKQPELARLKEEGPLNRFASELGQVRARLEAVGDKQLAGLIAETAERQAALEARFPDAFGSLEAAVNRRQAIRKALNHDPVFQGRNRAVIDAMQAVKIYEQRAHPHLVQLAAHAKTYKDSLKSPTP